MSMSALMTIAGLYSYRTDLFDNLLLPTAPTAAEMGVENDQIRQTWSINKNDFIDFLCLQTMGMCVAVPDADFLKNAIGTWSKAHLHEWQLAFETLFYKYNPLWNKDGKIIVEYERDERTTDKNDVFGHNEGNSKVTDFTHGYNGGTTHIDDNLAWDHANKSKGDSEGDNESHSDRDLKITNDDTTTTTEQGNIGVTMTQELIEKQRELVRFNIEELIIDSFKKQFLLMLW